MKYLEPSFSTFAVGSQEYRDNWDNIFKKKEDPDKTPTYQEPHVETFLDAWGIVINEELRQTVQEVATALDIAAQGRLLFALQKTCEYNAQRLRACLK